MRIRFNPIILCLCLASVSLPVVSQPSPRWPLANRCMSEPIRGRPYSAEFRVRSTAMLPSGEVFTHNSTERQARDAHGRFYHSSVFPPTVPGTENHPPLISGHVCDSAAGTQTMWSSFDRLTIVLHLPPPNQHHGCWKTDNGDFILDFEPHNRLGTMLDSTLAPAPADEQRPEKPTVEQLGPSLIQGIEAEGYRSFLPPAQAGQKDPPYISEEHWIAPSLGIWVMQDVTYPPKPNQTIKWSREPVSIEASEPDPLLFEPPKEYPVTSLEMRLVPCDEIAPPKSAQSRHIH